MQLLFVTQEAPAQNRLYDPAMHPGGRPTTKPRSALGQRLTQARERAGISQKELAQKLATDQQRIAYWERNATGFRSEVTLAKLAEILGVSTDDLLGTKPPQKQVAKPVGRARQLFDAVSKLPRRQQEKIISILEPFVERYIGDHEKKA